MQKHTQRLLNRDRK